MEMTKYKVLQQDVEPNGDVELPPGSTPFNVYIGPKGNLVMGFFLLYDDWAKIFPGDYAMELKAKLAEEPKETTPDGS